MDGSSTITVRAATAADSRAAVAVAHAVYEEYGFAWDMDDLHDLGAHHLGDGRGFWVAELDGAVVGITGLVRCTTAVGDEAIACDCALRRVYVHPDSRRRGAARALGTAAIGAARRAGARRMAIWTDTRFDGAHRLYESLGARRVDQRELGDVNDSLEYGYVLDL